MLNRFMSLIKAWPFSLLVRGSVCAAVVLDAMSALYFVKLWQQQGGSERLWRIAVMLRGINWHELETSLRMELIGLADMTMASMLVGFLCMNLVFYLYLLARKRWAWQYALAYAWTAALLQLTTLLDNGGLPWYWWPINLLMMLLYLLLGLCLKAHSPQFTGKGMRFRFWKNPG